jgi:hypothetical protein
VSVRALIFALARFGIATAEVSKALEKDWAAYRKLTGLDIYGKVSAAPVRGCAHAGFT